MSTTMNDMRRPGSPMPTEALTRRQRAVLDFVAWTVGAQGYPPSVREIKEAVGISSLRGVTLQLDALERKGYIQRSDGAARTIKVMWPDEPTRLKVRRKARREGDAVRRFLGYLNSSEGMRLRVLARHVPTRPRSRKNFDALLGDEGARWAVELTELVESEQSIRDDAVRAAIIR